MESKHLLWGRQSTVMTSATGPLNPNQYNTGRCIANTHRQRATTNLNNLNVPGCTLYTVDLFRKWHQFMKQYKVSSLDVSQMNDRTGNDAQQSLDGQLHLIALLTRQKETGLKSVLERRVNTCS